MMQNGFRGLPGGVPDLNRLKRMVAEARWVCGRNPEHVFTGDAPRLLFPLNPGGPPRPDDKAIIVTEVCLFCVGEYLSNTFPLTRALPAPGPDESAEPEAGE